MITYLKAFHLILILLLGAGCTTSPPRQDQDPGKIYQEYEGTRLPPHEIATVDLTYSGFIFFRVISIDDKNINKPLLPGEGVYTSPAEYFQAELTPGLHRFVIQIRRSGKGNRRVLAFVQATLHPGHTYTPWFDSRKKSHNHSHYILRIRDKASGEVVGGRIKDYYDMSWNDVQNILNEMMNERVTRMDVLEEFGVPAPLYPKEMVDGVDVRIISVMDDPFPENTLVYTVNKDYEPPFIELENYSPGWRQHFTGFLFLKFDSSEKLQNYFFVEAPLKECFTHPTLIDALDKNIRRVSCKYRLKLLSYSEYYALIGKPEDAYFTLESGIINAQRRINNHTVLFHEHVMKSRSKPFSIMKSPDWQEYHDILSTNTDRCIEQLVTEGSRLIERYPDILSSAQRSFTETAFKKSVETYGDDAATVERKRLAVYRLFVSPDLAQQADLQFSEIFGAEHQ